MSRSKLSAFIDVCTYVIRQFNSNPDEYLQSLVSSSKPDEPSTLLLDASYPSVVNVLRMGRQDIAKKRTLRVNWIVELKNPQLGLETDVAQGSIAQRLLLTSRSGSVSGIVVDDGRCHYETRFRLNEVEGFIAQSDGSVVASSDIWTGRIWRTSSDASTRLSQIVTKGHLNYRMIEKPMKDGQGPGAEGGDEVLIEVQELEAVTDPDEFSAFFSIIRGVVNRLPDEINREGRIRLT
jgi:hypothetical protein